MRIKHLIPAALVVLSLTGCVQTGQPERATRDRSVALEDAFVAPPVGGPQLLSVTEQRYPNATEQRILLANRSSVAGSNYLLVQYFGPVGQSGTGRTPLPNPSLASLSLGREARAAVPGIVMSVSPIYVQNRYGPFGYAVGRAANGDTCVYAWQRISGIDTSTLLMRARGTIQIRMRLCDAQAGEERLLHSMYGFTIRAYFSSLQWNPYGPPPLPDQRLGASGSPILPVGGRGFEPVIDTPAPVQPVAAQPRASRAASRPAQPAAQAAAPIVVQPLPAPIGPLVPPPPIVSGSALPAMAPAVSTTTPAAAGAVAVPPPPAPASACSAADRGAGRC